MKSKLEQLVEALEWSLEWIDAVPSSTQLPAMPGFDRDHVDRLIQEAKEELATPVSELAEKFGFYKWDFISPPLSWGRGDYIVSPSDLDQFIKSGFAKQKLPVSIVICSRDKMVVAKKALTQISAIENKMYGGDWDEIKEARGIADAALSEITTSETN